jgi:hypothetical protein
MAASNLLEDQIFRLMAFVVFSVSPGIFFNSIPYQATTASFHFLFGSPFGTGI